MSGRYQNISIFLNTMAMCRDHEALKRAVSFSIEKEKIITADEQLPVWTDGKKAGKIAVTPHATFAEASMHAGKVCALNFANAFNPGGGVERGANAQEESLCRISTLYPCITADSCMRDFYKAHKSNYHFEGYDDLIYTPDVIVFKKDDGSGQLMKEKDWYRCDVITCAAPNLHEHTDFPEQKLYALIRRRTSRILETAALENVDVLILGAFGCGAFRCNPYVVSQAMMEECLKYHSSFQEIVFAVYSSGSYDHNLEIFTQACSKIAL